ncbi:hypothetical protein P7D52_02990 [Enterococcus dongliensis]|uniref:ECF transporter S component n=1 Tax=Enterococcus dongliensis TaxID=2559925 RepID=A0ABU3EL04_9ENTE|nr:hypothetical protein [Enterococcus dongliensis]MDT2595528.1 hypothetical protein [Enterococcus dongliensis]MDT2603256.1 hypothetical protein [Enterococcus dongliensis]MDT2639719.1 hypothetical protein [Enterococcus dongliensis]MDT2641784.1 hypothetical protein [Enterococcus dongliensis]MDT2644218.1 hypothetical protein [Enterococcus dongliensis]
MALYALLTAVCVVGRLLTSLIPNVQPITAILLIVTLNIGVLPALLIGSLSIVITNLYLGMGIWTIAQIFSFAIIILLMGALKKWTPLKSFLLGEVVVSFLLSLLYGLLVSLMLAPFWGIKQFLPYYLAGVSFDVMHGIGTAVFYMLLNKPLIKIFQRYQRREKSV